MSSRRASRKRRSVSSCAEAEERLTYWQRWYREHPRICVHFSREEFEFLRETADKLGLSYRELIVNLVRDMHSLSSKLQALHEFEGKLLERERRLEERERALNDREARLLERERAVSEYLSRLESELSKFVMGLGAVYFDKVLREGRSPSEVCKSVSDSDLKRRICLAVMSAIDSLIKQSKVCEYLQHVERLRYEEELRARVLSWIR